MRLVRVLVLGGLGAKAVLLGAWWWVSIAQAERLAGTNAADAVAAPELFERSRGFRELLEAVARRGAELDQRETALAAREAALKSLEAALGEQVARLEAGAAPEPAASGGTASGAPPENVRPPCTAAMTKIYESMKPEEAGPIIERLDEATAKRILGCMKERQIGALLAAMNRDRAVALTQALANDS